MWLFALSAAVLTYTAWSAICLYRNYKVARTLGLPIIVSPVSGLNVPWIVAYKAFPQILPLLSSLPFGLGRWSRYLYFGWVYVDAGAVHDELGPAWVMCMPNYNEVILRDHEAARAVLARRKDFVKPGVMYDQLNMFGRNVDSVEGAAWQRHRRLTAPSLNENVSSTVWTEALRQVRQMRVKWTERGGAGVTETSHDLATLALHVWTKAGFGIQYDYDHPAEKPAAPHQESYRDAMRAVLRGFTLLTIFPISWLECPVMPAALRELGRSCAEFTLYNQEMVDREKAAAKLRATGENNLLASMVRASEKDKAESDDQGRLLGLSNEELFGNMFIFSLAGHETTANALSAAVIFLAANPRWQDWLREETLSVYGAKDQPEDWLYDDKFPQLLRSFACMLETLRLVGSAPHIPRSTTSQSQPLRIDGKEHIIPPNTFVVVNGQALHCDKRTWGDDAMEWRPDRWLTKGADGKPEIIQPVEGAYVPWASGPRVCPGKKFAQVEFVAVISYLFHSYRVEPSVPGKSLETSQKLAAEMIRDCSLDGITLQMRDSTRVPLVWSKAA